MDLLLNFTSGVYHIDGFERISYTVFGHDKAVIEINKRANTARWRLLDIEYHARRGGSLVATDLKKLQLWVFQRRTTASLDASKEHAFGASPSFQPSTESNLRQIHAGEFSPPELHRRPAPNTSGSPEHFSPREVYSFLIAACLRSLSLKLVEGQKMIPLSAYTFADCKPRHTSSEVLPTTDERNSNLCHLYSLKVDLLSNGQLQVALEISETRLVRGLPDFHEKESDTEALGHPWMVFMAPSSKIARKNWREDLLSFPNPFIRHEPSSTSTPGEWVFTERQTPIWRDIVLQWLQRQGLEFNGGGRDLEWVKLTVFLKQPHNEDATPRNPQRTDRLTLDWPADLCLRPERASRQSVRGVKSSSNGSNAQEGTQWFQCSSNQTLVDPVTFAWNWMQGAEEREKELAEREAREEIEAAEAEREQDLPNVMFEVPSPLDPHAMSYQEAQALYPTPSDGLPAHVTPGSTSFDPGPGPSSQQIDQISSPEMIEADTERKGSHPENGMFMPEPNFAAYDTYFAPTTLTEADFDFFDQPEPENQQEIPDVMHVEQNIGNEDEASPSSPDINSNSRELLEEPIQSLAVPVDVADGGTTPAKDEVQSNDDLSDLFNTAAPHSDTAKIGDASGTPDAQILESYSQTSKPLAHHTVDDKKYLSDGRFSFQPRKKLKISTVDQVPRNLMKQSPTSARSVLRPRDGKSAWPPVDLSKRLNSAESSDDSDSEASSSIVENDASRPYSDQISKSKLPVDGSHNTDDQINPATKNPGNSQNQKHWSIEDFDALAGTMLMAYFKPAVINWSLTHFLNADPIGPYQDMSHINMRPRHTTNIGQLLMHQVTLNSYNYSSKASPENDHKLSDLGKQYASHTLSVIDKAINEAFPSSSVIENDLLAFMRSPECDRDEDQSVAIFSLPPPHVRLQRSQQACEFVSVAPEFWETLGLEPAYGSKNVAAVVIYPWSEMLEPIVDYFLDTMESVWLDQKLGNHVAGLSDVQNKNGHFPVMVETWDDEKISQDTALTAFSKACLILGAKLHSEYNPDEQIILYIINPFEDPVALASLCGSFYELLRSYNEAKDRPNPIVSNIALQLIPIDLIASLESFVCIDPAVANNLAHVVYGRCRPMEIDLDVIDLPIPCSESIVLAQPVTQSVRFQQSIQPSSNVLCEDSCLHVAYCESSDRRWATAAWTDATGEYQHQACYVLSGNALSGAPAVLQEIWDTTLDIIRPRRVHWRVFVAKCGTLSLAEQKMWATCASSVHTQPYKHRLSRSVSVTVVAVNTSPALTVALKPSVKTAFLESAVHLTGNAAGTGNAYTTPVTTPHPQPAGSSPAAPSPPSIVPLASGSTPLADPQATAAAAAGEDAILVDKTDESWGVLLPRRANAAESAVDFWPALASGFLAKRSGIGELDTPALLEVNLMQVTGLISPVGASAADSQPPMATAQGDDATATGPNDPALPNPQHRALLREILGMYRDLGLLARLRRLEDRRSCVPWHVGVAKRGAAGLAACMRV